jgi:hypothetical protein
MRQQHSDRTPYHIGPSPTGMFERHREVIIVDA